ncbi:hypothetical protein [uncultured Sphingomonas sp.]|uniref:hypothetical protein n=1 Tax=uncultured Sphingomonas sp. TaxID=158754 RepID=UPI0025D1F2E8|nr:hypothetical protein [uncultured Sphingomonas sp.]
MPLTQQPSAAITARQTRQIMKGFAAQLSGRAVRGADRKVRRGSYDVDDRRARVSRPIGDGTTAGALGWIDCLLKVVSEWDDSERRKGGARPLGLHGMRVLEALLGRRGGVGIDFRTGCIEPALDTIAKAADVSRTTVVRALNTLKRIKVLDWVRRTQRTGKDGLFGPQREQVSNSYAFTPEAFPARLLRRFRDLLARKRLARQNTPSGALRPPVEPSCPEMRAALARMEATIAFRSEGQNASTPCGQYHRSGVEG